MKYLKIHSKVKGIAAVEFLVVLPLLLVILGAIAEFGNAFILYNTLSKTVQNGARFAVTQVYGSGQSDKIVGEEESLPDGQTYSYSEIKRTVVYGNQSGEGTAVLPDFVIENVGVVHENKYVVVTAEYPYTPIVNPLLGNILSDVRLTASAVMRVTR